MFEAPSFKVDPQSVEAALDQDLSMPNSWYYDNDVYEFEMSQIYPNTWHMVGSLDHLQNPGDHIVGYAGRTPVIVTRDKDGALHGFVNMCRHRGHPVSLENGCRSTLQCPYHAWTYNLDGSLRKAPRTEQEQSFHNQDFSLIPVALDTWERFVFVNQDLEAAPLAETHRGLHDLAEARGFSFEGYRFHARYEYDVAANWKLYWENASECYHCAPVHSHSFGENFDVRLEAYEHNNLSGHVWGQFANYKKSMPLYGDPSAKAFRLMYLWPSTMYAIDDYVAFPLTVRPTGPTSCRATAEMYVNTAYSVEEVEAWAEMYDKTLVEDGEMLEQQQIALSSGALDHGRLMPGSESTVSMFHRTVWNAYRSAGILDL